METHPQLYNALFAYPDPAQDENERPRREVSTTIQYTADNVVAAVEAALRFFKGRQRAVAWHFGELWCIKVSMDRFGPIARDGALVPPHSIPFFEWKIDHGITLEQKIEGLRSLRVVGKR